jgi:hypothetical protein
MWGWFSGRWAGVLWVILVGALSSAWCIGAGRELGPTFDEPFYLEGGMHFWQTGSFKPLLDKGRCRCPPSSPRRRCESGS